MDALLNHRGWWRAGPDGYVGPAPHPPAGEAPGRVALVDVRVQTLVGPPAQIDAEVGTAFGPDTLVVTQPLGGYRQQCFGADASELERAETQGARPVIAPYPLAVQAWRGADAHGTEAETEIIVERLGDTLLITVCQGARVLAYRPVESDPATRLHEIRRTLLGLETPSGPTTVCLASDLLTDAPDGSLRLSADVVVPIHRLPIPCVALAGLGRLPQRAGFVSRAAALALVTAQERGGRRRRALMAGILALVGTLAWGAGLLAQREANHAQRRLEAAGAEAQQRIDRLAPRKLGPLLRPQPFGRIGDLIAGLPPGMGLVEAVVESDETGTRVILQFKPTDPVFRNAGGLLAALRGSMRSVELRPQVATDGQLLWEARAQVISGARE